MGEHIPIELCKKCPHYNGHSCNLLDLDTCRYSHVKMERMEEEAIENEKAKDRILAFVVIFVIAVIALLFLLVGCTKTEAPKEEYHWSAVELLKEYHGQKEGLTEFQMLTMAIALTESRFKADAVGTLGDSGILQLRKCYLDEVNRLCDTDYTIEDAFDIGKSIEIFNKMQEAKNPSRSIDKAIALHNRGAAYRATVLRNLEEIKRYEKVREELVK